MAATRHYFEDTTVQNDTVKVLKRGGVVIIPTDTLYGMSTALTSEEGYARIIAIKECEEERNFLMLASSVDMVDRFICSWGCGSKERLGAIWPAPLTAIFPSGPDCPSWAGESIAFRVPDYEPVRNIIEQLGEPILSTSVNFRGQSPLHRYDVIEKQFGSSVDLLAESRTSMQDLPSTIVDFTRSEPHLVRQGSYPWRPGAENPSKA